MEAEEGQAWTPSGPDVCLCITVVEGCDGCLLRPKVGVCVQVLTRNEGAVIEGQRFKDFAAAPATAEASEDEEEGRAGEDRRPLYQQVARNQRPLMVDMRDQAGERRGDRFFEHLLDLVSEARLVAPVVEAKEEEEEAEEEEEVEVVVRQSPPLRKGSGGGRGRKASRAGKAAAAVTKRA